MKKIFLMTALAVGMLASCSEDELDSYSGLDDNTIAFATSQQKVMTRSAVTINSIDKFTVSAVNDDNTSYFTQEEYVYDATLGVFKSATPHYWPTTGTVSFYAISDPGTYTADPASVPHYSYTDWGAEKDLVAATVIAGQKKIPYPLTFKHITSQVYVSAEAEDKTNELTYKLVSVKMTAPSTGTYSFATTTGGVGSWLVDNSKTSEYSYDDALPISFTQSGTASPNSCYWNILPVTDGKLYFRIEYQVLENGKVISDFTGSNYKECIVKKPSLIQGKKYRYNFILSRGTDDEITFTTSVANWDDESVSDFTPSIALQSFKISPTDVWMTVGGTQTISVTSLTPSDAVASFTWSSSDSSIASVNEETGVVTAVAPGVATITVTSANGLTATSKVRVANYEKDENGNEYVDLGLSSGIKWAVKNVGASSVTDNGLYFQWGSTTGYSATSGKSFTSTGYTRPSDYSIDIDAVTANMGNGWRMPTQFEFTKLRTLKTYCYTSVNGKNGWVFENDSDPSKFLFLPMSGAMTKTTLASNNTQGLYYSSGAESSVVYYFALLSSSASVTKTNTPWLGMSMRGVHD